MALFLKGCAGVLLAVFLALIVGNGKGMETVLTIAVCSMVCLIAMEYPKPVIDFIGTLEEIGNLDGGLLKLLLKVTGIGVISEMIGLICSDSGNASMGKALQIMSTVVILWISMPLFRAFLELIQSIMGGI